MSVRAVFAYGAGLAMTPYLLIKVSWVVGAMSGLLPRAEQFSMAGFVVLNTVTIGMAAAAITLALALIRPWGERIPAVVVLSCAWIGGGFLIPMIPYLVLDTLLSIGDEASGDAPSVMPGWEASLIQFSFFATGLGLAVALPLYLRARWPKAFAGRVRRAEVTVRATEASWLGVVTAGSLLIGVVQVYWAAGGGTGLEHPAARDLAWYLQVGNSGLWSLAGAWGVWVLVRGRSAVPVWIPVSASWLASGFLVAWGCWKLPFTIYQAVDSDVETVWPEHLGAAAAELLLSIFAGVSILTIIVRTQRAHQARTVRQG